MLIPREKYCACPACGVVIKVEKAACGHLLCGWCRNPDHACTACHPEDPWTTDRARSYLLRRYFSDWQFEWAERDFENTVAHINSRHSGASGPHSPTWATEDKRIKLWVPNNRWSMDNHDYWHKHPDFTFRIASLLRDGLNERLLEQAAVAVASGAYEGQPRQAVLL